MSTQDWPEGGVDSMRSYDVAIAAKREQGVREGRLKPQSETELKWAAEGPVPVTELEAGRS